MLSLTNKNNHQVHNMNRYGKSLKEPLGLYFFAPMEWELFERGTHSKVGLISWPIFATSIVQNRTIFQAFWECFYLQIIVLSCKTFVFYNMFDILWWKISLKSITKTSLIKFYGHLWASKKLFASRGLFEGGGAFSNRRFIQGFTILWPFI